MYIVWNYILFKFIKRNMKTYRELIKESKSINPMTGEIKYDFDDVEKSGREVEVEVEKKEELNYKEFIEKKERYK